MLARGSDIEADKDDERYEAARTWTILHAIDLESSAFLAGADCVLVLS
jgi:hypothetical protein